MVALKSIAKPEPVAGADLKAAFEAVTRDETPGSAGSALLAHL